MEIRGHVTAGERRSRRRHPPPEERDHARTCARTCVHAHTTERGIMGLNRRSQGQRSAMRPTSFVLGLFKSHLRSQSGEKDCPVQRTGKDIGKECGHCTFLLSEPPVFNNWSSGLF